MKRILIPALALLLIIAVIFGITFISELSPDGPKAETKGGDSTESIVGQPFLFNSSECKYDPYNTESLQNRMFQGFYEIGDKDTATFWFKNRSPRPVTVTSLGASCTTCSAARIAHIPEELINEYGRNIGLAGAIDSLFPFGGPDLMSAFAAIQFDAKIPWQTIVLDKSRQQLSIPAGFDGKKAGLGIVQLQLTAAHGGSREPKVSINAAVDNEPGSNFEFKLVFNVVGSFSTNLQSYDVGEVAIGSAPKPFELVAWSATRDFGDRFPPPTVAAGDDPFVSVSEPVRMTRDEMDFFNEGLQRDLKGVNRIISAYKYQIKILRVANGKESEIGPFTKDTFVVGLNGDKLGLKITGAVTGIVRLREGQEVNFGTYEAMYDREKKVTLLSEKQDLDLKIVESETKPRFMTATLEPPTIEDGARTWKLNLKVAANQGFQANWNGVVVLTSSGPNPITIRVPVKGNGTRR